MRDGDHYDHPQTSVDPGHSGASIAFVDNDEALRLKCLTLALTSYGQTFKPSDVIAFADVFYVYVRGEKEPYGQWPIKNGKPAKPDITRRYVRIGTDGKEANRMWGTCDSDVTQRDVEVALEILYPPSLLKISDVRVEEGLWSCTFHTG